MHYKEYFFIIIFSGLASCSNVNYPYNSDGSINPRFSNFKFNVVQLDNLNSGSALIDAAGEGNLKLVKSLIKYNDVNTKTKYGSTALMYASRYAGNKEVILFLIENGANINAQANNGDTALNNAIHRSRPQIVKLLIDKKADIRIENNDELNALGYLSKYRNIRLVEQEESLDFKNFLAFQKEHMNKQGSSKKSVVIAQLLLDAGADVNQKGGGNPILLASSKDDIELVKFYIKSGANVNETNSDGSSPLVRSINGSYDMHEADINMVKLLIDNGANINFIDRKGLFAIEYARKKGYGNIVSFLKENGAIN